MKQGKKEGKNEIRNEGKDKSFKNESATGWLWEFFV